jgi:hypothetical protein
MDIILALLVILIAKGWAVTTTQLEKRDRMGIIVMVCILSLGYLILFIWDYAGQDPAATLYFFESAPGYIVIILRMATLVWFIYSLWATLRLETLPEKRRFYFVFGGIYTVWFLIVPIAVWPTYARRFFIITPGQGLISKEGGVRHSEPTL